MVHDLGGFLYVLYDIWQFVHLFHRKGLNQSSWLLLYYVPIHVYVHVVLSTTTKHNFIPSLYSHQTGICCKILYVVRDIRSRNRPNTHLVLFLQNFLSHSCEVASFSKHSWLWPTSTNPEQSPVYFIRKCLCTLLITMIFKELDCRNPP